MLVLVKPVPLESLWQIESLLASWGTVLKTVRCQVKCFAIGLRPGQTRIDDIAVQSQTTAPIRREVGVMVPNKILFCTDFSENSEPARELAVSYAKAFGAELLILGFVLVLTRL